MKKIYTFLLSVTTLFNVSVIGQAYNGPESVVYDAAGSRYLISNIHSGQILQRSNAGVLSAYISTGLTSPKGMVIKGDTLYVTDVTKVVGFKLATGAQVFSVTVTGSVFLNDIDADNGGFLYISDMNANRIYKVEIATGTFSIFVGSGLSMPNGLLFDAPNNRMLLCSFIANCPIQAINLANGNLTTVANTTIGFLDGMARDAAGNVYVSGWGTHSVYKFDPAFASPPVVLQGGFTGPADLYYNPVDQMLAVPQLNGNTVIFISLAVTGVGNVPTIDAEIDVFPNPASTTLFIKSDERFRQVKFINMQGQEIHSVEFPENTTATIPIDRIPSGIYLVRVISRKGMFPLQRISVRR